MRTTGNIQQFTDYRTFLVAHAQEMKRQRGTWSYGSWAKKMGLKATSSITKVIQGDRDPGPELTERLVRYFEFPDKQAQYFRDLVRLHKIRKDPRLSVLLMEKMSKEHPNASLRILDDRTFTVISNWHCLALRELSRMKGFIEDPERLSKQFLFKVTPREIRSAIDALIQTGLLKRDKRGFLQLSDGCLETTNDVASEAIKRYHEQMLGHAKSSLRSVPVELREISSVSFAMSSKNMNAAKELIRKFRREFERVLEEESGDRVFQLQIQLFPLTRSLSS